LVYAAFLLLIPITNAAFWQRRKEVMSLEGQSASASKTVSWVAPFGARDLRHRLSALGKEEIVISNDSQSCNVAAILAVETSAKEE
jgi:hypothetical protein